MSRFVLALAFVFFGFTSLTPAAPLRIFIRAGVKTHGPNQHDHPRFLTEWTKLLTDRGATVNGAQDWPTAEQFDAADVVVVYAQDPWDVNPEQKANIEKFTKRGGGLVVIHDGLCGHNDPPWVKSVIGGAWTYGKAKWFEGEMSLYYVANDHPITAGASNFDLDDEFYYDLDMDPSVKVLASTWTPDQRALRNGRAFPSVYNTAPQIWAYEKDNYRAFVSIPGHNWKTFEQPQYRAVLLRGIAWAGKRTNIDEFCAPDELASLRYPPGGPSKPSDELSKLVIHPDFKMTLVASEPLVNKVIALNWDAKGRLWVAETPEYPNGRRGMKPEFAGTEWRDHGGLVPEAGKQNRPAHDKISMLIDTDGDGVADKKQVFYEGLDLVTGFVFYKDGVIVTQAPDILWLRDTDGDGKADKVEVLYHGLGTNDTHAVINNPRWGMDGWIYATHGYSAGRDVTNGDGSKHFGNIGSGVVRFKPDGSAIEQYSSKGGNTWGLCVTWDDDIMWTQPTSGDLLMETILPESLLAKGKIGDTSSFKIVKKSDKTYPLMTWEQQAYRQIDWVGSFTAAAGCAIYDGGTWPASWNGSYFTTEPTINIVHHSFLTQEGVSYAAHKEAGREQTEFVVSKDMWFRPIEARIGPDGALYVVDFYNQAVIHNDTRGPIHNNVNAAVRPDRDHYFARIWRLDHKDAQKLSVPDLSGGDAGRLVNALSSVNQPVRMTAAQLLVEQNQGSELLGNLALDTSKSAPARIQALWILEREGKLSSQIVNAALQGGDEAVARNALKIVAQDQNLASSAGSAISARLRDKDQRTQLAAIIALGVAPPTAEARRELLAEWPALKDPFLQSAVLEVANASPVEFVAAALAAPHASDLQDLIGAVCKAAKDKPAVAADIVQAIAATQANSEGVAVLRRAALQRIDEGAKPGNAPDWTPQLEEAVRKLLVTNAADLTLPLIAAWDKEKHLNGELGALISRQLALLGNAVASDDQRGQAISTLIAVRQFDKDILPQINAVLTGKASVALQRRALEELGNTNDDNVGELLIKAYPSLQPILQDVAFSIILKRADWTGAFIDALKDKTIALTSLGTIALDKLRHYPNAQLSKLANEAIDAVRGPMIQQKDEVIAQLLPVAEKGGDAGRGKTLFIGTCAVCHKFNGEGANLAPDLTGMGAHSRAELLVDIVDPNREVDPSFAAFDFTMKNGDVFQGIISRENAQTVLVRDAAGEHELAKADIATRRELGRSLMPEGFEALGGETLRDILAYLQSVDAKYRIIDLRTAFDADSRHGLFITTENPNETLKFKRFGNVREGDVPFVIADPGITGSGNNLVILKGGEGHSKSYPQRVEIPVGHVQANALNFLGGIGGWAFPCCGDEKGEGLPAAKVTVAYEGGQNEEILLKNGVEFADYIRPHDVPGSKDASDLVNGEQVRVFRKALAKGGVIEKLMLESYDNRIAPVFVAITAENATPGTAPAASAPAAAATPAVVRDIGNVRILSVGGGTSHDFKRWFGEADKVTIEQLHPAWFDYTENPDVIGSAAGSLDVLISSTNQPVASEARKGFFDMANAGKGLVLIHPALWYNWANFPEYNRELVGGGTRGHDRYGEFEVEVTNQNHPVTAGLPAKFKIKDELYNFLPDPQGTPIEVLATATSPLTGKTFPQIWIVKHPKAKIVCITLGHDGACHDLPEYKLLLQNALRWAAGK